MPCSRSAPASARSTRSNPVRDDPADRSRFDHPELSALPPAERCAPDEPADDLSESRPSYEVGCVRLDEPVERLCDPLDDDSDPDLPSDDLPKLAGLPEEPADLPEEELDLPSEELDLSELEDLSDELLDDFDELDEDLPELADLPELDELEDDLPELDDLSDELEEDLPELEDLPEDLDSDLLDDLPEPPPEPPEPPEPPDPPEPPEPPLVDTTWLTGTTCPAPSATGVAAAEVNSPAPSHTASAPPTTIAQFSRTRSTNRGSTHDNGRGRTARTRRTPLTAARVAIETAPNRR
uniref:hypothetical protein n=1 Tax=Pseudonocardia sp. CA-138482 TaxID=3240023 RepID=UPI003F499E08